MVSYTAAAFSEEIIETGAIIEGQWSNENSSPYIQALQPTRTWHAKNAENVLNIFREYAFGIGQV